MKHKLEQGWTFIELMIVVGILAIVIAIAIAATSSSKAEATQRNAEGNAKTINEAITRATLKGDTNPVIVGDQANDVEAAAVYLIEQGYIR